MLDFSSFFFEKIQFKIYRISVKIFFFFWKLHEFFFVVVVYVTSGNISLILPCSRNKMKFELFKKLWQYPPDNTDLVFWRKIAQVSSERKAEKIWMIIYPYNK